LQTLNLADTLLSDEGALSLFHNFQILHFNPLIRKLNISKNLIGKSKRTLATAQAFEGFVSKAHQ
jgi:hypothetical protein